MKRKANAVWRGNGLEGAGTMTTHSGALKDQPYSTKLRFQDEEGKAGTNPEELIAAAHAGCFSMALSFQLANAGFTAEELRTEAVLTIEKEEGGNGWSITAVHLNLTGKVPGITAAQFQELAGNAKKGCPVSKVLNAEITMNAVLEA
ncbi:MAG: OsmC family protein [Phaeodactylibacter sp.]|nr:OsmC family protein [Phaeodactylibacter sp.]MCB9299792.1 OsmC family protein [Lewinellaceae bacterium]HQU60546.1 OsmC family protein [Saprospiraceae bacterium]